MEKFETARRRLPKLEEELANSQVGTHITTPHVRFVGRAAYYVCLVVPFSQAASALIAQKIIDLEATHQDIQAADAGAKAAFEKRKNELLARQRALKTELAEIQVCIRLFQVLRLRTHNNIPPITER